VGRKPCRIITITLLAAVSFLLVLTISGAAYTDGNETQLKEEVPLQPVTDCGESQRQAGFAAEMLPVRDFGFNPGLVRLGSSKIVNILLIGQDAVSDSGARSDAMILCTFNKKNDTITFTSFLRDMYVKIPGYKSNRINAAYRFGGTSLLNKTLHENFGIEVDGNIQVDFGCFERIIDKLGGVTMELTAAEAEFINTHTKGSALTEGTHLLTGKQALTYARNRYDADGDFSRTNRQRKLLNVLLETYKSKSLPEMLGLIQEILPMITTDISKSDLTGYAVSLLPMASGAEIRMQAIPVADGYRYAKIDGKSVLVPDLEKNRQALADCLS